MICPTCGATNRDGAAYCDSCGKPFGLRTDWQETYAAEEPPQPTLLQSGGLAGWMAADWLLRFVAVAVLGFVLGLVTLGMGAYGFSAIFFLLSVIGILGSRFMVRAK